MVAAEKYRQKYALDSLGAPEYFSLLSTLFFALVVGLNGHVILPLHHQGLKGKESVGGNDWRDT